MMQDLKILNSKSVKELTKKISSQFGYSERLEYSYLESSDGKVYILNKELEGLELDKLRIHSLGLCFGEESKEGFTLTIEGTQLIGAGCNKNVVEIPSKLVRNWLKGDVIPSSGEDGLVIVKSGNDYMGCGILDKGRLFSRVDKNRKILSDD